CTRRPRGGEGRTREGTIAWAAAAGSRPIAPGRRCGGRHDARGGTPRCSRGAPTSERGAAGEPAVEAHGKGDRIRVPDRERRARWRGRADVKALRARKRSRRLLSSAMVSLGVHTLAALLLLIGRR